MLFIIDHHYELLCVGDLIMVRTGGQFYGAVRSTTLSDYDHLVSTIHASSDI